MRARSLIPGVLIPVLLGLGLSGCGGNSEAARAIEDGASSIDGVAKVSARDLTTFNPSRSITLELDDGLSAQDAAAAIEQVLDLASDQDWGNGDFTVERGDDGSTLHTNPTTGVTDAAVADWFTASDALPEVTVSSARGEDAAFAGLNVMVTAEDVPEAMRTAADLTTSDVSSWSFALDDDRPSYQAQAITVPEVTDSDIALWDRIDASPRVDPVVDRVWRIIRTDTVFRLEVRVRVAGDPALADLDTDSLTEAVTAYAEATGITDETVARYPTVAFDVWYADADGVLVEPLVAWSAPSSGRPAKVLDDVVADVLPRVGS